MIYDKAKYEYDLKVTYRGRAKNHYTKHDWQHMR